MKKVHSQVLEKDYWVPQPTVDVREAAEALKASVSLPPTTRPQ